MGFEIFLLLWKKAQRDCFCMCLHIDFYGTILFLKEHWTTSDASPIFFPQKVKIFMPLEVYAYVGTARSILLATLT